MDMLNHIALHYAQVQITPIVFCLARKEVTNSSGFNLGQLLGKIHKSLKIAMCVYNS